MQRALLPSILTSLGLILIIWALPMPLFEWEINLVDIHFPPMYQIHWDPSPWVTEAGKSLEDDNYIRSKVSVRVDQNTCLNLNKEGLNITVERSPDDKILESILIGIRRIIPLLFGVFLVIVLSELYIWQIAERYEDRPNLAIVISAGTIVIFFLIVISRLLGPRTHIDYFGYISSECRGTLTLNAKLSKIHYEILVTILASILSEVAALGIMLHQLLVIARQRKETSKSAVG